MYHASFNFVEPEASFWKMKKQKHALDNCWDWFHHGPWFNLHLSRKKKLIKKNATQLKRKSTYFWWIFNNSSEESGVQSGQHELTENCNWGREFSISEEGLAVNLRKWVIGVRVTRGALHSRPFSNGAVPSHDTVQNAAVVLREQWHDSKLSNRICTMIGKYWSRTESGQIYLKLRLKTGRSDNSSNKLSLSAIENKSQYIICSLNRFWRNPITTGDTGENYVGFQIIKKKRNTSMWLAQATLSLLCQWISEMVYWSVENGNLSPAVNVQIKFL